MYSATRTISLPSTLRISIRHQSNPGGVAPANLWFDSGINSAVIGDGWSDLISMNNSLFLPVTGKDGSFLNIVNPKILLTAETASTNLTTSTLPPTDPAEYVSFTPSIQRLDTAGIGDPKATILFSVPSTALPALGGAATTVYTRAYLVCQAILRNYELAPTQETAQPTHKAIRGYCEVTDAITYSSAHHLYLVDGSGTVMEDNVNTDRILIDRADIVTDSVQTLSPLVLGIVSLLSTDQDDVTVDKLEGSATAMCEMSFRMVA